MKFPYKVISISVYKDDLRQVDLLVERLTAHGVKGANRSSVIRHALSVLDESKIPPDLAPRGKS